MSPLQRERIVELSRDPDTGKSWLAAWPVVAIMAAVALLLYAGVS